MNQIETWRCWSEPGYFRRVWSDLALQKHREKGTRSASYQVKRAEPVEAGKD
ncbi:hypothetical protein [Limnochorda pilosa]|uniref:Uncharacterized protein n=1 Tax=Limnochorda pilosa TaxID=1555112 RepID=A0A0K2SPT1_LIMPI|nr:hypothetical protein [Limnochorda pilosa]BAS28834.1 hypothetical protein LIP_3005 [Limnochorda pilosa]